MFSLPNLQIAYMSPRAISMKWGRKKLIQFCKEEMGIDPALGNAFLFFNASMNQMKLFFLDATGCKAITKTLPQQGFSLPIQVRDKKCIQLDASQLKTLFESPK